MPLNADWGDVDGWKELHEDDEQYRITEALAFRMMNIGMWQITPANYEKYYVRLLITDKMYGCSLTKGGEDRPITLEEVKRRIGLSANVSTLTDAAFKKKVWEYLSREAERTMSIQRRKMAEVS